MRAKTKCLDEIKGPGEPKPVKPNKTTEFIRTHRAISVAKNANRLRVLFLDIKILATQIWVGTLASKEHRIQRVG